MQAAAATSGGTSAHATQIRVRGIPHRAADAVCAGSLRVGVAVEFARTGEAGVCGTGGGHHGVRKGSHASFVGVASNSLEVFGEKHTKG
ncbi:hypothetical protein GCM10010372_43010 [Streptomyces tauricus]|nr:hypothetical protein GCM10010372_43010 [Streptomyces tauricus]